MAPVSRVSSVLPNASIRKKRNHNTPHDSHATPNQTSHTVCAPAKVWRKTGTVVIATNRQNQPRPRPSAPFHRFQATQKYVKVNSRVRAAALMDSPFAPGPNARYIDT